MINSTNLQAGLRQRAAMVQFGAQVFGSPALSALDPGDMAAVQSRARRAGSGGEGARHRRHDRSGAAG